MFILRLLDTLVLLATIVVVIGLMPLGFNLCKVMAFVLWFSDAIKAPSVTVTGTPSISTCEDDLATTFLRCILPEASMKFTTSPTWIVFTSAGEGEFCKTVI